MISYGTRFKGQSLVFLFNTTDAVGAPITIGGTAACEVYKDGGGTQITGGITVTEDFDGVVGLHKVVIDTTNASYTVGSDYHIVVSVGTADGVSIVGASIGHFYLAPKQQVFGSVAASPAPSTTTFTATVAEDIATGAFDNNAQATLYRAATGAIERRKIATSTRSSATAQALTFSTAFSAAPASGDLVKIE